VNIDFSAEPGFSAYVLLLMASGIAMVVMASPAVRQSTMFLRVLNTVVGLGFFGYGFYLTFLFDGGSYWMFFQAFVLPVVLIFRTVQAARLARREAAQGDRGGEGGVAAPAAPTLDTATPAGQAPQH
jgi:hypothetical protein